MIVPLFAALALAVDPATVIELAVVPKIPPAVIDNSFEVACDPLAADRVTARMFIAAHRLRFTVTTCRPPRAAIGRSKLGNGS